MDYTDDVRTGELALGDIGAAVKREWPTAVMVFLATVVAATALAFAWPPTYEATATVAVHPLSVDAAGDRTVELNMYTEQVIVTSRQVASEAVKLFDDTQRPEGLQKRTTVVIPDQSSAMEITVAGATPQRAADAANAVAEAYLAYRQDAATKLANDLISGIDAQISALLTSLSAKSTDSMRSQISQQIADLRSQKSALSATVASPGDIVSRAVPAQSPSSPIKPLYIAVGLVLGSILAFLLAWLKDRLSSRVGSAGRLATRVRCRVHDHRPLPPRDLAPQVLAIMDAHRRAEGEDDAPRFVVATDVTRVDPALLFADQEDVVPVAATGLAGIADAVAAAGTEAVVAVLCTARDKWREVASMTEALREWGREPAVVAIVAESEPGATRQTGGSEMSEEEALAALLPRPKIIKPPKGSPR